MPLLLAVFLSLCAPARAAAPASAASSADAVRFGAKLFNESGCRACHSVGGVGGNAGPDLTLVGFRHSAEWLDDWVKDPRAWKHDTLMPNFRLSDSDRAALVAYLSSLDSWAPAERPWKDAAEPGKVLFNRAGCVACHGVDGRGGHPNNNVQGGVIPALPALVATYTKEELVNRIRSGKVPEKADPSGPDPLVRMPAWGQVLSDEEISQVADYLLTLAPKEKKGDW